MNKKLRQQVLERDGERCMNNNFTVLGEDAIIHCRNKASDKPVDVIVDLSDVERIHREIKRIYIRWDGPRRPCWRATVVDLHGNSFYLSRWLMGAVGNVVVDHIDHNTLNNRKRNLRVVGFDENSRNRKGPDIDCRSGVRNVHRSRGGWAVCFRVNGKTVHAGRYGTIEEASRLADTIRSAVFNGTWVKQKRVVLHGKKMNELNRKIHERDGGRCVVCSALVDPGVKFHHAIFKSHGGDDSIENGVVLCNDCHTAVHGRIGCPDGEQEEYRQKIVGYLRGIYGPIT